VPNKDKNCKYKYKKEIIDSTKTKSSNRTIPMFKEIEQILRQVRKLQAKNKLKLGQKYLGSSTLYLQRMMAILYAIQHLEPLLTSDLKKQVLNIIKYIHSGILALRHYLKQKLILKRFQNGSGIAVLVLLWIHIHTYYRIN